MVSLVSDGASPTLPVSRDISLVILVLVPHHGKTYKLNKIEILNDTSDSAILSNLRNLSREQPSVGLGLLRQIPRRLTMRRFAFGKVQVLEVSMLFVKSSRNNV
jgi:hypothetical protein